MTVRAKFVCNSVEQSSDKPVEMLRSVQKDGKWTMEPSGESTWPRTYRFAPQYDQSVPEDQRYAKATPFGELRIGVDNPNVVFEPGKSYYLDFTPVEDTPKE